MDKKTANGKAIFQAVTTCLVVAGLLFGSAGTFHWWNGWLFVLAYFALVILLTGFFSKSPDLARERTTAGRKAKHWDQWLFAMIAAVLPLLYILLAGLDQRFGWTAPPSLNIVVTAFALMVASTGLTFWAMWVNPFFSSHVRIQKDRGQKVVSEGPYRFIRHPGYSGAIIFNLAAPVVLGSFAAIGCGVAILILFIVRTVLEDKTLQNELKSYRAYTKKVRYKLVPYIW